MKDYRQIGLNPYLKKEGSLPLRPMNVQERQTYIPPDVVFETGGTILSPNIVNPMITGGTISGTVFGTIAEVTGGTFIQPTIGSPTTTGGNYNTGTFAGTPVITNPAITNGTANAFTLGSPTIVGGNYNTGTFAGTPVITNPSITNGTANGITLGSPVIVNGTFNNVTLGTPAITGGTATSFTFSNKINVLVGANLSVGKGTLAAGVATISTTTVGANSNIFLTPILDGANLGILAVGTINAGTSFVVQSSNVLDTDSFNYWIIN